MEAEVNPKEVALPAIDVQQHLVKGESLFGELDAMISAQRVVEDIAKVAKAARQVDLSLDLPGQGPAQGFFKAISGAGIAAEAKPVSCVMLT